MTLSLHMLAMNANLKRLVTGFEMDEIIDHMANLANYSDADKASLPRMSGRSVLFIDVDVPVTDDCPSHTDVGEMYSFIKFVPSITDTWHLGNYESTWGGVMLYKADMHIAELTAKEKTITGGAEVFLYYIAKEIHHNIDKYGANVVAFLNTVSNKLFKLAYKAVKMLPYDSPVLGFKEVLEVIACHERTEYPPPVDISDVCEYLPKPGDNPHLAKGNTFGEGFHVEFMKANPDIVYSVTNYKRDVELSIKHQHNYTTPEVIAGFLPKKSDDRTIIHIKPGSKIEIESLLSNGLVRFTPGKGNRKLHYGTFEVFSDTTVFKATSQYDVYWLPGENDDFVNAIRSIANRHTHALIIGLHLTYLLNEIIETNRPYQMKHLYLAFNALEVVTGKPFYLQAWMVPFFGENWFQAVMLRRHCEFPI